MRSEMPRSRGSKRYSNQNKIRKFLLFSAPDIEWKG
jgi:hypothetical protein